MSIDLIPPTLGVQAVTSGQDAGGKSGREAPRDGKPGQGQPGQGEQGQPDLEQPFLNSLGQVTGKTINIAV